MKAGEFADGAHVLRAKIDMAQRQHQPARSGHLPHPPGHAPPHRRCLVHLPDVHLRPPDRGRAGEHHPLDLHPGVRGPAALLRLAAGAPGRGGCWRAAAAADRVRAPEPELRGAVQAQADPAGRGEARRRLGRPAPADAGRRAPARLHARGLPPLRRAIGVTKSDSLDRLQRARGMHARRPQRARRAPHRRARPAEAGHRQLSGRAGGGMCAPNHPQQPELGKRPVPFSKELWIEREDFMEVPSKGYFRLFPGNRCACATASSSKCTGCEKDAAGNVVAVHCDYFPDSKSARRARTPTRSRATSTGSRRSTPTPLPSAALRPAVQGAEPRRGERDFLEDINPDSKRSSRATGAGAKGCRPEDRFQFERHGYFVADRVDSRPAPRCSTAR
jgi:hypothetical protein